MSTSKPGSPKPSICNGDRRSSDEFQRRDRSRSPLHRPSVSEGNTLHEETKNATRTIKNEVAHDINVQCIVQDASMLNVEIKPTINPVNVNIVEPTTIPVKMEVVEPATRMIIEENENAQPQVLKYVAVKPTTTTVKEELVGPCIKSEIMEPATQIEDNAKAEPQGMKCGTVEPIAFAEKEEIVEPSSCRIKEEVAESSSEIVDNASAATNGTMYDTFESTSSCVKVEVIDIDSDEDDDDKDYNDYGPNVGGGWDEHQCPLCCFVVAKEYKTGEIVREVMIKHLKTEHLLERPRPFTITRKCRQQTFAFYFCVYPGCGYKAKKYCRLLRHTKVVHFPSVSYICQNCGRKYLCDNGLSSQTYCSDFCAKKRDGKYACQWCPYTVKKFRTFKRHQWQLHRYSW